VIGLPVLASVLLLRRLQAGPEPAYAPL